MSIILRVAFWSFVWLFTFGLSEIHVVYSDSLTITYHSWWRVLQERRAARTQGAEPREER